MSLPPARLQFLFTDAGARILVTSNREAARLQAVLPTAILVLPDCAISKLQVDTEAAMGEAGGILLPENDGALAAADCGDKLCHIAYTSGSTGSPKGVACRHRNLMSYCLANAHTHEIGPGSRVLLAAAAAFDPSIGEAYTALLTGATLVLAPRAAITSALGTVLAESRDQS